MGKINQFIDYLIQVMVHKLAILISVALYILQILDPHNLNTVMVSKWPKLKLIELQI